MSIDGRRETVYSAGLIDAHMSFYAGASGASSFADALQPDYVWIPSRLKVVRELQQQGWRTLCEGSSSILLTRRHAAPPCDAGPQAGKRLFPEL